MKIAVLSDVLDNWAKYDLDDSIYVPAGTNPTSDLLVSIVPFDPTFESGRIFNGQEYLFRIEQMRDVVEGLETQIARSEGTRSRAVESAD